MPTSCRDNASPRLRRYAAGDALAAAMRLALSSAPPLRWIMIRCSNWCRRRVGTGKPATVHMFDGRVCWKERGVG